jgi:hypothetical protein
MYLICMKQKYTANEASTYKDVYGIKLVFVKFY